YHIDLDLAPQNRWDDLAFHEGAKLKKILQVFKDVLLSFSKYSANIISFVDNNLGQLVDTLPQPYRDELKGLANATNLPLGEVLLYNLFYEVFTVCTSILAEDDRGNLYHARNMDFGLFMGWDSQNSTWLMTEALKDSVVNLKWKKNGQVLFKSVNYVGYIGVFTAMKPGAFSLTVNERFNIDGGYLGILKWLLGYRQSSWLTFITRQVMETARDFHDAYYLLRDKELLAPVYFILGGNQTDQAVVITRSRLEAIDVWHLSMDNSTFYLLETNYDHWSKPPFYDDRRSVGRKCMDGLTKKNVGFLGLFDVLSSKPVLNKLTTYTTLMQVSSGRMESYIQYCQNPCSPW
ncbi:hypothetical protein HELRODRAFT_69189, partial [Helobdella robusta]|uniref:Acid ceramidase n=1 Tax=Helobdella robusta TaxID=6412 RepID=T1FZQ7_HELRO